MMSFVKKKTYLIFPMEEMLIHLTRMVQSSRCPNENCSGVCDTYGLDPQIHDSWSLLKKEETNRVTLHLHLCAFISAV